MFYLLSTEIRQQKEIRQQMGDALFVNINKVHLIQSVTMVIPMAFYLIRSETYSKIHAARTRQYQMIWLYEALDSRGEKLKSDFYRILLDLEPDVVIDLGAIFVDVHKDQLIRRVTKVMPILHELFYEKLYRDISIKEMTRQDQMEQLYEALEEAEDSRSAKLDFYRILLDLEPDLVIDLDSKLMEDHYRCQINLLNGLLEEVKREKGRADEETIQSLSTSPGGQQETQTPSQKSERIEGVEMKSLPGSGRKSLPEKRPLLAAGPQTDDLDEMERGGTVTIDNNSML
ncbi:uncharacterized protein LOC135574207 isoform X2 [Oncorhynchus nerka]|uniref:uncharacterized protein LOC135574207 isoform X2 n=1 Tax=Oncorhynchus nerka TaxID=8023 RepID=UPI0031B82DEA